MRQSIFIGKLENKPELRSTAAGTSVATLSLMVSEKKGETWETHRFKLTLFGYNAERIARQANVGSEIVAICRPESREYKNREGRLIRSEDHVCSWVRVCVSDGTENDSGTIQ